MRFVCEVCQTRYIIPDERARGRVLKVRCKKCGKVIIVRPEGDGAETAEVPASIASPSPTSRSPRSAVPDTTSRMNAADDDGGEDQTQMVDAGALMKLREQSARPPPRAAPPPPDPEAPPPEPAEWHVVLAGKQLGPLTMNALIEKMLSGDMTSRTFIWRDGMGDWKRAEEVPEVSRWLPAQPSPTPPPQKIPQPSGKSTKPAPKPKAREAEPAEAKPRTQKVGSREVLDDSADVEKFFAGEEPDEDQIPAAPHQALDPFSQVGDAPGLVAPKPGETTRFFITQAGVEKHRSPWRIAAYAGGFAVFFVLVIVALSQLGVQVPLVSSGDGSGVHIFSGRSKDGKIKDLLYGKPKEEQAAAKAQAPQPFRTGVPNQPPPPDQGPLAKKTEQHVDTLDKKDKDKLAQLYASQSLSLNLKPSAAAAAPVIDRTDAPLTADQVAKTIDRFRSGYAACIDRELKRNPGFQGGKIRIVTTIMSSGLVRQAQIQSDDARVARNVSGSPLGGCLTDQTRRMVFPSFQGEPFDAEIPLVVGASM